jgi:hypothetical protein
MKELLQTIHDPPFAKIHNFSPPLFMLHHHPQALFSSAPAPAFSTVPVFVFFKTIDF